MSSSAGLESKSADRVSYKLKYKLLKRCIKEIVLENAALCDQASDIQHQIIVAQEERKFLWKKYTTSAQGASFAPGTDGDIQLASIGAMSEQAPTPSTASRKPPRKPSTPRSSSQNNGATPGIPSSSTPRSRQTASRKRTSKKLSTTTTSTPAAIEDAINDSISSTINELVNSAATNS